MKPESILVVDNDPKYISLVRQGLNSDYLVIAANNGERAIHLAAEEQPIMMILEIALQGNIGGYEVISRIREFSDIPIIILSSIETPENILRAYKAGVDDFINKPFNSKILLARINAILKRYHVVAATPAYSEIICSSFTINLPRRQVTVEGEEIYLSETEYNLLLEFARHSNQVLLHEYLLSAVWGPKFRNEIDYLRSYVHTLRRKLESNPSHPKVIISKPGLGYMLVSGTTQDSGEQNDK
jgi:two-component system KDP operon response regulator KdpE